MPNKEKGSSETTIAAAAGAQLTDTDFFIDQFVCYFWKAQKNH